MTSSTHNQIGSYLEDPLKTDITISTTYTTIQEFHLFGMTPHGTLKIDNTGGTAFSNLKLQKKVSQNGAWVDWIEGADFSSLASQASESITELSTGFSQTLAGGAYQTLQTYTGPIFGIRIQAKVASGTTTANASAAFGNK